MTRLFNANDAVPREWFTQLDNVEEMHFMCPCLVETTETMRTIRKAEPALDGPMIYFKHVPSSNGHMTVQWDRETLIEMPPNLHTGGNR